MSVGVALLPVEELRIYVKERRSRMNYTQETLAAAVGLPYPTYRDWESGQTKELKSGPFARIIDVLNIPVEHIRRLTQSDVLPDEARAMAGERLDKKTQDRIEEIISETPPEELDAILEGIRAEARRNPSVLDTLRSLLDALRARDGHQSH